MNWIILVLIATVLWAIAAIINKFCREKLIKNSLGYIIFATPVVLVPLFLLFFESFTPLPMARATLAIGIGALLAAGYYLYIEALAREEVSRVFILFEIIPVMVLILSTIFLKEILTVNQYIAFALIFAGSLLISFKFGKKLTFTSGAYLVILSSVFFALHNVSLKYLSAANLTTVMIYREGGYFISILVLLLFPQSRAAIKKVLRGMDIKKTAWVYSGEILGLVGVFFFYWALQKGPISLVSVLAGFEVIFVFILAIIISIWIPKILKEEISLKTIAIKIISITLMLGGLYLIWI